jgi:hypothetical protein
MANVRSFEVMDISEVIASVPAHNKSEFLSHDFLPFCDHYNDEYDNTKFGQWRCKKCGIIVSAMRAKENRILWAGHPRNYPAQVNIRNFPGLCKEIMMRKSLE